MFASNRAAIRRRIFSRVRGLPALLGRCVCAALVTIGVGAAAGQPQSAPASAESGLASLPGHVHRFAQPRFDAGEAPNSLRMGGLELIIARSPAQQQALDALVAQQQNPKSAQYHRWLTPAEYGSRFGASEATIAALSHWLEANGLHAGAVPAGRAHLPFSGDKEKIESAFQTRIHLFNVNGEAHYANVSDPKVPSALKPLIAAVRGLNDFRPKPGVKPTGAPLRSMPATPAGREANYLQAPDTYYSGAGQYPGYVGPTDFATMYNLLPAYQQGVTGTGVTVAIAAQSDLDPSVLATFWAAFAVAGSNFGLQDQQFTSMSVPTADGGVDPGQTRDGEEDEAYLDTEIVGALAPGAKLVLVRDQVATTAAQYVIDQNLAGVLNLSFGQCENAEAAANAAVNSMWEQAASEGITVTVSSGDAGVAGCTAQSDISKANDVNSTGFAVNGLASTPYDLAVGGTDFYPQMESQYWSTTNAPGTLASALSHIPEIVWNNSCANPLIADEWQVFDPIVFCNTSKLPGGNIANPFIQISGSGAGVSSCTATDAGGNCTGGYAQPSWQVGFGVGSFGARAIPDVAMIATRWLVCSYDTTPCDPTQAPTFPPAATGTIKVLDGTSAAAPSVAAIIAMLDQTQITPSLTDGRQGLVNPVLYQLAFTEYASPALETECNASGTTVSTSLCVFFNVTQGSNAQPCSVANYVANAAGSMPASTCTTESGDPTGVMEVNGTQDYVTNIGLDIASGLGSINATALITAISGSNSAPTGLSATAAGQTVTLEWAADAYATSGYDVYEGLAPGTVASAPVQQNVTGTSTTISGLELGQSYVFAVAAVSSIGISPQSDTAVVTILPAVPTGLTVAAAGTGLLTLTWAASSGASSYDVFGATISGGEGVSPIATGVSGTSTTVGNLTAGQKYFFTVAAVDAGGTSAPSAEASGTAIPARPTALNAAAGNATVNLTWTAATGATSYNVFEGTVSGQENSVPVQTALTGLSATVGGLANGTTYYFYITAVDAGGSSGTSNEASATPAAPPAPSGGGGGGSVNWMELALLALLAGMRGRAWRRSTAGICAPPSVPRMDP
jgi:subtilase family serine protease